MVQETLHRIAARPPLSQPDPRTMAVTITLGLNDEYLLQGCSRASSWRCCVGALLPPAIDHQTTNQLHPEPCTPILTCCSQPLTSYEAPTPKPADSQWRSLLRDSPQRPPPAHAGAPFRWPVFHHQPPSRAQRRKKKKISQTCFSKFQNTSQ